MMDLKTFTTQVHKMRLAQDRYFELAAKARKTSHPDDHKARKDALAIAKGLETAVDAAIKKINEELATPAPAPEERPAIQVQPLTD